MREIHFVTPPSGIKIRFIGTVDMARLYKIMKLYLEDRRFAKNQELEKNYIERVKANGKQIEAVWECSNGVSDYFKYKIKISFLLIGVNEVEVQKENFKIKMYKGDFQITIVSYVEQGSETWDSLGLLTKIYQKLVAKNRLDSYINDLYDETLKFQNYIKNFLELRT